MTRTKYNDIPDGLCNNYFAKLISKIYKILPLKEEQSPTVSKYISSLLMEMTGNREVILTIRNDGRYLAVIGTLESLIDCEDIAVCKREVFKCIRAIEELDRTYFGG